MAVLYYKTIGITKIIGNLKAYLINLFQKNANNIGTSYIIIYYVLITSLKIILLPICYSNYLGSKIIRKKTLIYLLIFILLQPSFLFISSVFSLKRT